MNENPPPRCRIHGISNCQSMKKAFAWLSAHGIAYDFVDYRRQPPTVQQLDDWLRRSGGGPALLNTRGTTWRRLSDDERASAAEPDGARRLMARQPTLIKRPVIDTGAALLVGFDPARYAEVFAIAAIDAVGTSSAPVTGS